MNPDSEALIQKARASLGAAKLLKQEGYLDFAASRAYYAMFYAAQALLLQNGLAFSSHSGVIAAFGKEFAKTAKLDPKLHRYLLDASQDLRNASDYGIGSSVDVAMLTEVLGWAAEFIAAAEGLLRAA